jgi:hypothetical protein
VAEVSSERLTYIALLREAEGNERAVSFESPTGEEAHVGDEITVDGAEWHVLAIEPEDPPWAGVLVCERVDDEIDRSEHPSGFDDELPLAEDAEAEFTEDDLPLHLRILRALLEGEPNQKRIDQALELANEVCELEASVEFDE